nr:MAG TPA: hypothetical protein [Bacteriophage sp.]
MTSKNLSANLKNKLYLIYIILIKIFLSKIMLKYFLYHLTFYFFLEILVNQL